MNYLVLFISHSVPKFVSFCLQKKYKSIFDCYKNVSERNSLKKDIPLKSPTRTDATIINKEPGVSQSSISPTNSPSSSLNPPAAVGSPDSEEMPPVITNVRSVTDIASLGGAGDESMETSAVPADATAVSSGGDKLETSTCSLSSTQSKNAKARQVSTNQPFRQCH